MLAYLFTLFTALVLSAPSASASLLHTITAASTPAHVLHQLNRPAPSTSHTVLLTLTQSDPDLAAKLVAERSDPQSPLYLQWLDKATLGAMLAGTPASTAAVNSWVASVPAVHVDYSWGPYVQLKGSVAGLEQLFNTTLAYYTNTLSGQTAIRSTGTSYLPDHLDQHITNVDGLHTGDIVSPVRAIVHSGPAPAPRRNGTHTFKPTMYQGCYTSLELSQRYGTPNTIASTTTNTNSPTSVSVIQLQDSENYDLNALKEFGQDESFAISDLSTLVTGIQLLSASATNTPTSGSNDESMLDLEAVVSVTTTSKIYASKVGQNEAGHVSNLFGYFRAASPLPQVMSLSYSYGESQFSSGTLASYEGQVQALVAMGVTFLAATGDSGYNSNIGWPATSAYVLAVGGTMFSGTGSSIVETAWSVSNGGSTGGLSSQISRPSYQTTANTGINTAWRAVPDVSALAWNFFIVYGDQGSESTGSFGGTSLATPIWASTVTYLNALALQYKGSTLGFINPLLYQMAAQCSNCFFDITSGTSNGYSAKPGYDLLTGIGSPNLPAMKTYLIALWSGSSSTAPPAAAPTRSSSSSTAAAVAPTAPPPTTCTLNQATAVGYFNNAAYSTSAGAGANGLYTTPLTITQSYTVVGLGIQSPSQGGSASRQTSVIQLALYQATGNNGYTLLASTAQLSINGAGGSHTAALTSSVTLSAGTYFVGLFVKSTGNSGVGVYLNTASTAVAGPDYGTTSLPSSFTATGSNYPFRVELLKC